ncbi:hypothetical protein BFJ65_g18557 [Fusarium oxysporum f. sp. cepae]|uniref:Uncharacterized protein n=1 Tax=Fusarium oxysporum f. sp. cepae TaxID=396571 RepID=A0A3L6MRH1_FUSOX|nr:hypothetical protein BFJ65_g18557 [Fusarium oxysporum f. sp. cepae]
MTQGTAEKKANSKGRKPPGQQTLAESMKLDLHDPENKRLRMTSSNASTRNTSGGF